MFRTGFAGSNWDLSARLFVLAAIQLRLGPLRRAEGHQTIRFELFDNDLYEVLPVSSQ
jgi:hypothetical protein